MIVDKGKVLDTIYLFGIWNLLFVILIASVGCTSLRGYVSGERGFLSARVKQAWGEGEAVHEYYITREKYIVNVGDSNERIHDLLGFPDAMEQTLEGYEIWFYKNRNLKLYFDDGCLKSIKPL